MSKRPESHAALFKRFGVKSTSDRRWKQLALAMAGEFAADLLAAEPGRKAGAPIHKRRAIFRKFHEFRKARAKLSGRAAAKAFRQQYPALCAVPGAKNNGKLLSISALLNGERALLAVLNRRKSWGVVQTLQGRRLVNDRAFFSYAQKRALGLI